MQLNAKALRKLVFPFLCLSGGAGCGGDYSDDYLDANGKIAVGKVRRVSTSGEFDVRSCQNIVSLETRDCIRSSWIYVGLPDALSYAGDPETVYDLGELLFGETNLDEPETIECGALGRIYKFRAPESSVDGESDPGLLLEIGDDIVDSSVREFRFNIRGESVDAAAEIHLVTTDEGDRKTCAEVFGSAPERTVQVVTKK